MTMKEQPRKHVKVLLALLFGEARKVNEMKKSFIRMNFKKEESRKLFSSHFNEKQEKRKIF